MVPILGDTWLGGHSSSADTRIYWAGIRSSIGTAVSVQQHQQQQQQHGGREGRPETYSTSAAKYLRTIDHEVAIDDTWYVRPMEASCTVAVFLGRCCQRSRFVFQGRRYYCTNGRCLLTVIILDTTGRSSIFSHRII